MDEHLLHLIRKVERQCGKDYFSSNQEYLMIVLVSFDSVRHQVTQEEDVNLIS